MKKINISFKKLKDIIEEQLKRGTTPSKLSLAITLGFVLGIIPFPGINTGICLLLAWRFKLNIAVIQFINYAAFPLQIMLFIPFVKIASSITGSTASIALDNLWEALKNNPVQIFGSVISLLLQGVMLWFVVAIPLYFICFTIIKKVLVKRFAFSKNSSGTV